MKNILFDLDGTLTNPFLGITKSVQYSLRSFNIDVNDLNELKVFIGPPLVDSFQEYYHMNEKQSLEAVNKYREYFQDKGLYENEVYDGIEKLLQELIQQGYHLYVCTSKPVVFARKILEHFHLDSYFKGIYGSELDGTRNAKKDVIAYCLQQEGLDACDCIMVGDRKHDIIGAHDNQMKCIGVLYGFGGKEEFNEYHCDYIVSCIDELKHIIEQVRKDSEKYGK